MLRFRLSNSTTSGSSRGGSAPPGHQFHQTRQHDGGGSSPGFRARALFTAQDIEIIRARTPHIRRALSIPDPLDEQNAEAEALRRTGDRLAIAVAPVAPDRHLAYVVGARAEALSDGDVLTLADRKRRVSSAVCRTGLMTAVPRACSSNDLDLQSWRNGIALPGRSGRNALACVLPPGRSEHRNALGPGMATVFMTEGQKAAPPSAEVVAAVTGLTTAQARVALAICDGVTPQDVADRHSVSINPFGRLSSEARLLSAAFRQR